MDWRRSIAKMLFVCVAMTALALPGMALAQEDPQATQLDRNLDKYWGERREIRTIEKRLFRKDTRFQASLYGGVIPNDDFQLFVPMGLRLAYFLTEDIAIELSGAYALGFQTRLKDFLTEEIENKQVGAQVFLTQEYEWYGMANMLWSPVHGKIGMFTNKLFHFDFYLAVGVGVMGVIADPPGIQAEAESQTPIAANIGFGAMMYLTDFLALQMDYRQFFHEFQGGGGGLSYPAEITLGLAFFTNAPE